MKQEAIDLAKRMDGRQYPGAVKLEDTKFAKDHNLLIVHGYSDDIVQYDGAFCDEGYGPVEYFTAKGRVSDPECDCDAARREHVAAKAKAASFDVCQGGFDVEKDGKTYSVFWNYKAHAFPYAQFDVMEDDSIYCIGMVIDLDAIPGLKNE